MKYYLAFTIVGLCCFYASAQTNTLISPQFPTYNPRFGPDYSKTIYPKNNKLTYNQYVGETIAGYTLADGWREDTINGGFNKEIYRNPYVGVLEYDSFVHSHYNTDDIYFYYKAGKKYTGIIKEQYSSHYTKHKIVFRAKCIKGLLQGEGTLTNITTNKVIGRCTFENSRMSIKN